MEARILTALATNGSGTPQATLAKQINAWVDGQPAKGFADALFNLKNRKQIRIGTFATRRRPMPERVWLIGGAPTRDRARELDLEQRLKAAFEGTDVAVHVVDGCVDVEGLPLALAEKLLLG